MAKHGGRYNGSKIAGFNSPKSVRASLQAALYYARQQRLSRIPGILSTVKQIESSTEFDIDFTNSHVYSGGQTGKDAIGSVPFTLGANDTASTDDPTILYAGTPQGKAKFDGGDFFRGEYASLARHFDPTTHAGKFPWVAVLFKKPPSLTNGGRILSGGDSALSNNWNIHYLSSGSVRFSQTGGGVSPSGNRVCFSLASTNSDYVVAIFQADFDNSIIYSKLNGQDFDDAAYAYTAYNEPIAQERFVFGAQPDASGIFDAGGEIMRVAFGVSDDLLGDTRGAAILNQIITDHQKPFIFPTADSLVNINANCVLDVDAALSNSFPDPDSEYLINTVTGNKFTLGANATTSTDNPTFNGSIGSSDAYFSFDGGDYFDLNSYNAVLDTIHHTTAGIAATFIYRIKTPTTMPSLNFLGGTARSLTGQYGFNIILNTDGSLNFYQIINGGGTTRTLAPAGTFEPDTEYVFAIAQSQDTNLISLSVNGEDYVEQVRNFSADTTAASSLFNLMANSTPNAWAGSGTQLKHFSVYDKYLSQLELSEIITALNAR